MLDEKLSNVSSPIITDMHKESPTVLCREEVSSKWWTCTSLCVPDHVFQCLLQADSGDLRTHRHHLCCLYTASTTTVHIQPNRGKCLVSEHFSHNVILKTMGQFANKYTNDKVATTATVKELGV